MPDHDHIVERSEVTLRVYIGLDPPLADFLRNVLTTLTTALSNGQVSPESAAAVKSALDRIEQNQQQILTKEDKIMDNQQQALDALKKIDDATTKMGTNVGTLGNITQSISDEMDALVAAQKNAGVSAELVAQTQALADKAQLVSDSLDLHATALTAIASKGAVTPVPIPPPPAPVIS